MKFNRVVILLTLGTMLIVVSSLIKAQASFTVNSLADDEYAYAWDDPNTTADESRDGICRDELGRCTIRAAIEESNNMQVPLTLDFSVSGRIDLIDVLYPTNSSLLKGDGKIELSGLSCFEFDLNVLIRGFKFNNSFEAIRVVGNSNLIGSFDRGNVFINCYIALSVLGDNNIISGNLFGLDSNKVLGSNQIAIMITGNDNEVGFFSNTIVGSTIAAISIDEGGGNKINRNFIGTTADGDVGYGNAQGIVISGSDFNTIGGETYAEGNVISGNTIDGIVISGVPPDSYSFSNDIRNNIIGLNPSQTAALPNRTGIVITNGTRLVYTSGNVIAGNTGDGIKIFGYDNETVTYGHFIVDSRIGINQNGTHFPNGGSGINIYGNVVQANSSLESVIIGRAVSGINTPNIIVGNAGAGISISNQFGYSPSKIVARGNLIYQNNTANLSVSPQSNNAILPPYGLSFSNNTIAGIHDIPNSIIDIYKSSINEFHPSSYEWLGSTTVGGNGVFSYQLNDTTIEAVSVTATSVSGNTSEFSYLEVLTGVENEDETIPAEFSLAQNFPNPFNPTTKIKYSIPAFAVGNENFRSVQLKIYDILGKEITTLVNDQKAPGSYEVEFNALNLPSGTYFYQLQAKGYLQTRKMMLLK